MGDFISGEEAIGPVLCVKAHCDFTSGWTASTGVCVKTRPKSHALRESHASQRPLTLTLALTKTGYISRICHSIGQTKLRGPQYLYLGESIVLPIVTAEWIR